MPPTPIDSRRDGSLIASVLQDGISDSPEIQNIDLEDDYFSSRYEDRIVHIFGCNLPQDLKMSRSRLMIRNVRSI